MTRLAVLLKEKAQMDGLELYRMRAHSVEDMIDHN